MSIWNIYSAHTDEFLFEVEAPGGGEAHVRAQVMLGSMKSTTVFFYVEPKIEEKNSTTAEDHLRSIRHEAEEILVNKKNRVEEEAQGHDRQYLDNLDRLLETSRLRFQEGEENPGVGQHSPQ